MEETVNRPYIEEGEVRTFTQNISEEELVWHRDKEDRILQTLHSTDWKFQFDNQTPEVLSEKDLFIPKETYHRLIKGNGNLKLRVIKIG